MRIFNFYCFVIDTSPLEIRLKKLCTLFYLEPISNKFKISCKFAGP